MTSTIATRPPTHWPLHHQTSSELFSPRQPLPVDFCDSILAHTFRRAIRRGYNAVSGGWWRRNRQNLA